MTAKLDELLHHCGDLGIDVDYEDLSHKKHRGEWRWWCRAIVLHEGLTTAQTISVLAHEIGHVMFGDECSTPAVERRAWEYAASLLVTPEEYRDAEAITGPHSGALAKELGVTVKLVDAWRRWWSKRGQFLHPESLRFLFEDSEEDEFGCVVGCVRADLSVKAED